MKKKRLVKRLCVLFIETITKVIIRFKKKGNYISGVENSNREEGKKQGLDRRVH